MATRHSNSDEHKANMAQPNPNDATPTTTLATGRRQMLLKAIGVAAVPLVLTVKAQKAWAQGPAGTMPSPMSQRP
jgi:hypothetical protein